MPDAVIYVLGFLLVVAILVYQWRRQKARREALGRLAHGLGWSFRPERDGAFHSRYGHKLFDHGRHRRGYNLLSGGVEVSGRPFQIIMGDYEYVTGQGKSQETHRMSLMLATPPYAPIPSLIIRREGLGDKLLGAFGFDDIDFESEEFSRKYFVKSSDKRFAYAVVHPRMMEYLLQSTPPHVEFANGVCLLYDGTSRTWSSDDFRRHIAWTRNFFELWPEHLIAQMHQLRHLGD